MPKTGVLDSQKIDVGLLLSNIKEQFKLSDKEIKALSVKKDIKIPIEIFNRNLGMLESITLYLHDDAGLSFNLIAKLLQRKYNTIWTSYNKAKKKIKNE
jgi:hypothetical protein|tara:strand:+ start:77 stop:373 length:297 start_codon:yes stop_codon:yes gene_type:complete